MIRNMLSHFLFKGQRVAYAAILTVGLALSVGPVQVAHAATFVVDRTDDVASASACTAAANDCSLRGAIFAANNSVSLDTIQVPAMTFFLTLTGAGEGDLDITDDLEITGALPGATVDGSDVLFDDRVFEIATGVTATITNLTITNAQIAGGSGGGILVNAGAELTLEGSTVSNNTASNGGGVGNSGTLTLNNSTVSGNTAVVNGGGISSLGTMTVTSSTLDSNSAGNNGGGIFNLGTMTVTSSAVSNNTAVDGGGISNFGMQTLNLSTVSDNMATANGGGLSNPGTMTVTSSSIESNSADGSGGGVSNLGTVTVSKSTIALNDTGINGGGVDSDTATTTNSITNSTIHGNNANRHGGGITNTAGTLTLNNVTIAGNTADADADLNGTGNGGGITVLGGQVAIGNTIIGLNADNSTLPDPVAPDCSGALNSLDYNLIQNVDFCSFTGATGFSLFGVDPILGPLQDNGGDTLTRALLSGSPAIDAGNPALPGSGSGACEATDQRGMVRPLGTVCDIGAYERDPATPSGETLFLPLILNTSSP